MKIAVENREAEFDSPVTVGEALREIVPEKRAVAARCFSRILELNDSIAESCTLQPISLPDDEARRIIERSLHLVMLAAVRRLYPGQRVRIEHSAGRGVQVYLPGMNVGEAETVAIEQEMRRMTAADTPFEKTVMKVPDAVRLFEKNGLADKAQLLQLRPTGNVTLHACEGMWEYLHGPMLPSAGGVGVFAVYPSNGGFTLMESNPENPEQPAKPFNSPRHLAVFAESARWCSILGVQNAADLSRMTADKELRRFIRINEALHTDSISAIAEEIVSQHKRIVFVAGPSSSGKTTFSRRLDIQLRVRGCHPVMISMDDYYLDRAKMPKLPDGTPDFEHPEALNLPLLRSQMNALLRGESIHLPKYDFKTGLSSSRDTAITLPGGEVLIMEGIHGLNPMISEGITDVHRIFVSALTCLNLDDHTRIHTTDVRLLRRMVRDNSFRGTTPVETLRMWPNVTAGERRWIFPFQEQADSFFNTTLHYELPFLKARCFSMLGSVPKSDPFYPAAHALFKLLGYIPAASEDVFDEIPPVSILREFVGGLSFDKD